MKKKNLIKHKIIICCVALYLIAFTEPVFAGNFKLGVVLPLSGEKASIGNNLLNAVKFSASLISQEKGVKFDLVIKDDKNDPAEAEKAAKELVQDKDIVGVIGHYYSSTAMGATKIYDAAKIPVLCVYASDPRVGQSSKYVFSMNYSNKTQAEYMAVYIKEVFKKDNILVINNNDAFGISLKDHFLSKAKRIGLKIFKHLEYDHRKKFGDDFISAGLPEKEANKKIGAVVVFSHSDSGIQLVKHLREHKIDAPVIGPNPWFVDKFIDETIIGEEYTRNVYVTSPFLWEIANYHAVKFIHDFQAKYGEHPNIATPMCHDAVLLFASSVKEHGGDREKTRDFFASLTWQSPVAGLTGNLYFDKDRMMDRDVFIAEIKDGRFKVSYVQLAEPREPYVLAEKEERLKKGYLIQVDEKLYHWIDVVFIGVDFYRIKDVNTRQMTFDLEFFLWFKWMGDRIDVSEIEIINAFRGTFTLLREDLSKPVKYRSFRYKGSYVKEFNMSRFPFDTQKLPITLGHKSKNSTHLMLVADSRHMTFQPIKEIFPQEWSYLGKEFDSGLYKFDSTFGDPDYRMGKGYKSKIYFSTVTVSATIKRVLFPYIFTIFFPLAIILIISLLIVRIPASLSHYHYRSAQTMTALLSLIVYHLAQRSVLPIVGYLMKVDYYFIVAYFFMLGIACINVIAANLSIHDEARAKKLNRRYVSIFIPLMIFIYALITFLL